MKQSFTTYIDSSRERGLCTVDYVKYLNFNSGIQNFDSLYLKGTYLRQVNQWTPWIWKIYIKKSNNEY